MNLSLLLFALQLGAGPAPWSTTLSLPNGGLWRERVAITLQNRGDQPAAGAAVELPIGSGPGEAKLQGEEARALRVTTAAGQELLWELRGPAGESVHSGPIPAGSRLILPAEAPAHGSALCYAYVRNPRAWQVPDYFAGAAGLRNGGFEAGDGETPAGWSADPSDPTHRLTWERGAGHVGRRAVKTEVAPGADPTWISMRQNDLGIVAGAKYRLTGWVRAESVVGSAGWYIHIGNGVEPMLLAPTVDAGSGAYDWRQVTLTFTAPAGSDRASLGTVLRGTGRAWFDDVSLVRLDGVEMITASASEPERLTVHEAGEATAWSPAGAAVYRAPVRVVNLSAESRRSTLVAVDVTAHLGRLHLAGRSGGVQAVSGGRTRPHFLLGSQLLFPAEAPAQTVQTSYLYYALARGAGTHASAPAAPAPYALNPALPGGKASVASTMDMAEYGALLASHDNLARNPSFEGGGALPDGWAGGAEGQKPAGAELALAEGGLFGRRCGRIQVPARAQTAWTGWRQSIPVQPNRSYLVSAWMHCANLVGGAQLYLHLTDAAGALVKQGAMPGAGPAIAGTTGWTLVSTVVSTPEDCRRLEVHLTMNATGTLWHDGVVVAEVTPGDLGPLEPRPSASLAQAALQIWPVNALVKVFREETPQTGALPARITCARGEKEPLQIAIRSGRAIRGVQPSVGPLVGPGGATLSGAEVGVVGYVPIDHVSNYYSDQTPAYFRKLPGSGSGSDGWAGWWPDPLLPVAQFDLEAGQTQPIWLTVSVPRGAPAGDYRGRVTLSSGGRVVGALPFTVHVWNFEIPEFGHLKAIYDNRQGGPMWQVPGQNHQETLEAFWRFEAAHRVCPDQIEPEPTITYRNGQVIADFTEYDRAAELYFDTLKFPHAYTPNQFYLFGWANLPAARFGEEPYEGVAPFTGVDRSKLRPEYKRAYQACLKAYWDHVKAKGWASKITMYISDEPFDSEAGVRTQMKAICDMVHEVDPAIRIYSSTWHHQPEWDGYLNVWGFGHYGLVPAAKMAEVKAGGATLWWTTDGMMCTDTPYLAIERLLPYYCFKFGAEAYEFWGIDWLTYDPYEYGWHSFISQSMGPEHPTEWVRYPNGDGFLAYPPAPLHLKTAVPSIRLEQAREGVEDYEYLYLLNQLVVRAKAAGHNASAGEAALNAARALAPFPAEIGRYSTRILPEPDRVFEVKQQVARAIEALNTP